MESIPKKTDYNNNQEKKKGAVGRSGGGIGIGAFILVFAGGALATTAVLAIVKKRGKKKTLDPPPDKASEQTETANKQHFTSFPDYNNNNDTTYVHVNQHDPTPSNVTAKDIEIINSHQSEDDTSITEQPQLASCDSQRILCPTAPQLFPLELEDTEIQKPEDVMTKLYPNSYQEKQNKVGEIEMMMGEIREVKCEEVIWDGLGLNKEGICHDHYINNSVSKGHDQERVLPEFNTPITTHENLQQIGNEKQGFLFNEVTCSTIYLNEAIERGEESLSKQHENYDRPNENIIPHVECDQDSEVENEGKIPSKNTEKHACGDDHQMQENRHFGDYHDGDVQILATKDIETSKANVGHQNDLEDAVEKKVEDLPKKSHTVTAAANVEENKADSTKEDLPSDDSEDYSSMDCIRGVWSPEAIQDPSTENQLGKLINKEVEGKIQEDTTAGTHQKQKLHSNRIIAGGAYRPNVMINSAKSFIERLRHVVDLATLKDYSINSTTRRMLVATIPILSSLSCFWFFGLSFHKLCLVMLLSIILSKSMIIE